MTPSQGQFFSFEEFCRLVEDRGYILDSFPYDLYLVIRDRALATGTLIQSPLGGVAVLDGSMFDRIFLPPIIVDRDESRPPVIAEFLLAALVPTPDRDPVLGDMEEFYRTKALRRFGARRARLWYWTRTAANLGFYLWDRVLKPVLRWVIPALGIEQMLQHTGLLKAIARYFGL